MSEIYIVYYLQGDDQRKLPVVNEAWERRTNRTLNNKYKYNASAKGTALQYRKKPKQIKAAALDGTTFKAESAC